MTMREGEGAVTVTVRMDPRTLAALDRVAAATERSRSSAVRWAVRLLLDRGEEDGERTR